MAKVLHEFSAHGHAPAFGAGDRVAATDATALRGRARRDIQRIGLTSTASQVKRPQKAVAVTAKLALRHVLGLDLDVKGRANLPRDPHIVAHNLVSPLDAFVVALALTEAGHDAPVIVLDYELAGIPLLRRLMNAGALAVDHSAGTPGDDDPFGVATRALWEGRCVITAPEQVVSPSLEVLPVRSGPIRLGVATNASVVPTATFGAHRLFDEAGKLRLRRRGAPVGVTFGTPTMLPEDTETFLMAQRTLQFDLEGLLGRTLDDYPDREEGEAGASWWPSRRGGTAPDLLETLEDMDRPTPTIELWADDRTVVQTRRAKMAGTVPVAPDVHEWTIGDDEDDEVEASAVAPEASLQRPGLPDPLPLADVPMAPRGVDGMLAFDLPGLPRKLLRRTRLEAQDGHLSVFVGDTAVLNDVKVDRRADKTLFTGRLGTEYRVASGDVVIDVPAGTQATLVALRDA